MRLAGEVVRVDLDRRRGRRPLAPAVLELADQLGLGVLVCVQDAAEGDPECRTIEPGSPRVVAGKSFVVLSNTGRRSPRPRPGRTSPSRRSRGGVTRWRQASAAERASLACLAERSSRPHRFPGRVPAAEERRICELRERTGWSPRGSPTSPRSPARTRPCTGSSSAPASRAAPARAPGRGALPVAVPGPVAAHGHQEAGPLRAARARRHRRPRPPLAARRVGVRALDRRRLQPAGLLGDPRRREGRHRDRLHRAGARLVPRPRDRRRAADDRQRVRLHPQPLAARAACRRAIRHIRTRPYTPRTNGKVERYQQTLQREWAYALEYASSDARAPHCHTGCAITTSGAPTAPSATALPSNAFGRSPGSTPRSEVCGDPNRLKPFDPVRAAKQSVGHGR